MALSAPGIGSNLDVNSIVAQLMQLEQRPLIALAQREARFTAQISTLGRIKGALSGFQAAAATLKNTGINAAFKLTSSDATSVSGSASSTAAVGSYRVSVSQLAQAQALVASGTDSPSAKIGDGAATTLSFSFGAISGGSFDDESGKYAGATFSPDEDQPGVQVEIDGTNNTLEGIRDAINAAGGGVIAAIVNDGSSTPYRLTIASTETGAQRSVRIEVSGDATIAALLSYDAAGTQNLSQTQAAQDAQLSVNGIPVSRATNTAADVIDGVSLTLSKIVVDATISVQRDSAPVRAALEGLVKAYNEANKVIAGATAYKAILQGDSATVGIQNQLRSALGTVQQGLNGSIGTLSQLGVSFQPDGSLAFNASILQASVDKDYAGVSEAAAAFGASLSTLAGNLAGTAGAVQARTDGLNRSIADIDRRRESIQQRLVSVEKRYRSQFAALDAMMASMLQTSDYLQQQLSNLPKINRS